LLGGVKGLAAKNQLEQLRTEDRLAENRRAIETANAKKKAEKQAEEEQLRREAAMKAEHDRLEREKALKEEEEKKAREASRARLASKAALWQ
jgi:hypothetical protein